MWSEMGGADALSTVLRAPAVPRFESLRGFWAATAVARARFPRPIDQAIACAALADRVGSAFAAGYEAALCALVPSLERDGIASFCLTEAGGGHPRAIETRLEHDGDEIVITGGKRWSTMAPLADVLILVAREGTDADGRPRLRAVCVPRSSPGLTVKEMPAPPFVPEVPHGELLIEGVRVPSASVLPGDGFTDYAKAFRTVEDLHVNAAVLAYLISVAARNGWPEGFRERGAALLLSARELATRDPKGPETHLALSGLLAEVGSLAVEMEAGWSTAGDAERERWQRDRPLVQVAGKAREQRRMRAWQALSEEAGR